MRKQKHREVKVTEYADELKLNRISLRESLVTKLPWLLNVSPGQHCPELNSYIGVYNITGCKKLFYENALLN